MYVKNGIKSTLRMPGRSLLTFLLFFLVTALFATSLGVTESVFGTLNALSDSYTTIAVVEYISEEENTEAMERAAAEIAAMKLPDSVIRWSPERMGQCFLGDSDNVVNANGTSRYGVVVIETRTPGTFSSHGTISAVVKKALFSLKDVDDKKIEVYAPGIAENTPYLVYGEWYTGVLGTAASLRLLLPPLQLPSPEEYATAEGAREYLELAEQLRVRTNSVTAAAPEDIDSYFPFQQKIIQIKEGRGFTEEEKAGGKRVCLLPERLAKNLNCGVGDTIPLSIAAGTGCAALESYQPSKGFDLSASFTVVGVLNAKDAWSSTVFLPPQPELDFSGSSGEQTVGQFLLHNDQADDFVNWAADHMPTGVRVTVYDQGYAEASGPIRIMLRTVRLITAACVGIALCFLLLNIWLFVSRQKRVGLLMHRLGVSDGGVVCHFLSALLPILVPALALGTWFSVEAERRIAKRLASVLNRSEQADLRYSDAQLSLRQSVELIQKNASKRIYLLIACGVLIVSLLLCWFLACRTVPKGKRRRSLKRLRAHTRTRSLSGGAVKYALLAAERGGFRTWISVLAPLAAAVLFCLLASASDRTRTQLRDLEENATVRGYYTDVKGTSASGLLVKYSDAFALGDMEATISMTGIYDANTAESYWDYLGKAANWDDLYLPHLEDYQIPELPSGPFLSSILAADRRKTGLHMISTSSMNDVPALMYSARKQITWEDGYSDRIMQGWEYGIDYSRYSKSVTGFTIQFDPSDSWEEERIKTEEKFLEEIQPWTMLEETPCVVSAAFLQAHGLSLGDSFFVTRLWYDGNDYNRIVSARVRRMRAVGSYSESSDDRAVYCPMEECFAIGPEGEALRKEAFLKSGWGTSEMWKDYVKHSTMNSAIYRFRASELNALKERMQELGLTEVGNTYGTRKPFILEDQTFLAAKRSVEQRLWYMKRTFPVAIVLTELLALLLSLLQILSRRRELWLMHLTGSGKGRAFLSVALEQVFLCPLGAVLGLALCKYLRLYHNTGARETALFAGIWLVGSLTAALLLAHRPKKSGREE